MSGASLGEALKASRGWLIAIGIAYVIIGFITIGYPMAATIAVEILVGIILLAGGTVSVVGAFFSGNWKNLLLILLSGILYLVVGYMFLKNPFQGVITLTFILAVFLLIEGFFRIIHAFQMKPSPNWVWLLVSGVASVILGAMIWAEFPASSAFIIGLLVGIYLLINGFSLIMFSAAIRQTA